MHYIPNVLEAFNSIEHVVFNVYGGGLFLNLIIWLFVYINFFILIVNYPALMIASQRNTNSSSPSILLSWSKTSPASPINKVLYSTLTSHVEEYTPSELVSDSSPHLSEENFYE
jgi:hypothetical protein